MPARWTWTFSADGFKNQDDKIISSLHLIKILIVSLLFKQIAAKVYFDDVYENK